MTEYYDNHKVAKTILKIYKKEIAILTLCQMLRIDALTAYAVYNDYNVNVLNR